MVRAANVLPEVDLLLQRVYGKVPQDSLPLGNKRNPLDELVYIQLSVRTREVGYQATYPALRRLVGRDWNRFFDLPQREVLAVLRSGGMAVVKMQRLRKQFLAIRARFGRLTLAPLRMMDTETAEELLRSLDGVGPKVARCVLLYSLNRSVFPVDSNCQRVLKRLGFLPHAVDIKAAHDFLQALVPEENRRSVHVNLIHHGREICLVKTPVCSACPLLSLCPTGKRQTACRMRDARSVIQRYSR